MIRLGTAAPQVSYAPPVPTGAALVGSGLTDTDFTGNDVTFELVIDGSGEDIVLDANYTNVAGVIAAIVAIQPDAIVTENGGVLTIESPTTGASSLVRIRDYTETGAASAGFSGDEVDFGADTPSSVVGTTNVQDALDQISTQLANPVAITFAAAVPGVDNVVRIGPDGFEIFDPAGPGPGQVLYDFDETGAINARRTNVIDQKSGGTHRAFEAAIDPTLADDDAVGFFGGEITRATRLTIDPTTIDDPDLLALVEMLITLGLVIDGT